MRILSTLGTAAAGALTLPLMPASASPLQPATEEFKKKHSQNFGI